MYPSPIELYFAPATVPDALGLLGKYHGRAKLIAGGQSLMPMLKARLVETQCLIDLNRVSELAVIREDGDGLCLGPMVRHAAVAADPLIDAHYGALGDAARAIGDPQIRNRGTIGGSLVHADPAADYPVAALAMGARLTLTKASGQTRTVTADQFVLGPLTTAIGEDELLTEVRLPKAAALSGGAFVKHSLVAGDFAIISAAAQLTLGDGGRCRRASIAIGGLASKPELAAKAAELLVGTTLDDSVCQKAGELAASEVEVASDARASDEYRRNLIRYYVPLTLRRAVERAGGAGK